MSFVTVYSCSAEYCPSFPSHMFTLSYSSRHLFACKTRGLPVPRGAIFYSICLSMVAVRAQPRWPLEGLTFRNIFLFSTHLFSSVRNEGKDTRLKGESRRLASSSHPSALRQRSFRLRRRPPPTDCNAGAMPITLAT